MTHHTTATNRGWRAIKQPLAVLGLLPLLAPPVAAAESVPHLDGSTLGLAWTFPFAGLLLSIAIVPALSPRFWHRHHGKIAAGWTLAFVLPLAFVRSAELTIAEVAHTLLLEYLPFVILLLALFTIAGGVQLEGRLPGRPAANTGLLTLGTLLASIVGTTGAAMLLVRPLIAANRARRHHAHVFVFFIFLVANIGGSLTPLGDPPLFLGFLAGVSFFWPTVHLLLPMLLLSGALLAIFFALDSLLSQRERPLPQPDGAARLGVEGKHNLVLLAGVLGAVLMSGLWDSGVRFSVLGANLALEHLVRDALLLALTALSLRTTRREIYAANGFSWFPILEVAKLFAGLFLTIIPAIAILRAGSAGALAAWIKLLTGPDGRPIEAMYFWLTGVVSSFLDNAPTYLIFFNSAGGDAVELMGPLALTLTAISAGAVFMGANTYIGNAPNFMVKSICEASGVRMPSFFGYMAWSSGLLFPLYLAVTLIFFAL